MQNLYTTPEASRETGIPESTIRSWLRRHPGVFQIDVHVVVEESGRKMWTDAGIELLRSRNTAPENATDDDAENSADDLLESLLANDANALAHEYWRQFPGRVIHRIRQMRDNPTPQDREIMQTSLRAALAAGTSHLLLPTYQPMLLEGDGEE
ncbi:helix-turn-helix domain-containing protein [Fortiea contorta]|uniref:helix-turn-helix domain-containing protein n=1 Tax=Fortiea contorta TaxID=1892405 RepID=UPI000346CC16|nr:helix-turn-helix domain-containing protein [Fortiea contorta]